ncbi:MAG TPA: class I SAM-dependent methyltransferase [Candidatus Binatia bacterium]|jgi:ubiquinone/menaquinone biosynthesis C-methylase UbiE|nr:class I SAM-dependent methyltransferase [Candidatus Binatia bacterium]
MIDDRRNSSVPALGHAALTALYDPVVALTTRERIVKRAMIRQARIGDCHRVLDLGSGTGTMALWIKLRIPGADVTGHDADPAVLSRARAKAAKASVSIRFDEGFSYELPYPDKSFDRVVSSLFFHHLSRANKRKTIREAYRVLRPGGELHVADWGKPQNALMRGLFYAIQLLDGFSNTADNVAGLLPQLLLDASFQEVAQAQEFATLFGTMTLYRATRSP